VSAERDPARLSRQQRRYARDLAEKEQRTEKRGRARPEGGEPKGRDGAPAHALSEEELDSLPLREKHGRRRASALRRHVERAVETAAEEASAAEEPGSEATVVSTSRGPCEVEWPDGAIEQAHLAKALARDARSMLAVGDRVALERRPSGELAVVRRLARRSSLSRPDPFHPHRERVLVANLERGVVVASARHPPLSTGLLDRFLVALAHGRVPAAIVINKLDLIDGDATAVDAMERQLAPYRELGVPVVLCSARRGDGLSALRALVARSMVAFVGHSGVGKSSLLNALVGEETAPIGAVSTHHGKGRHTTTGARIYRLAGGARIVDTPGVREFGLWRLTPRELATYFDEFAGFVADCRFADCSHVHEPGCAVREAAERGDVSSERFATYLRILESFERD